MTVDYTKIPNAYMKDGLQRWVEKGIYPGSFLTAVLENNLFDAVGRADATNINLIKEWVVFIYNELPSGCYGSRETMEHWSKTIRNG
jgi:hypothetical protein